MYKHIHNKQTYGSSCSRRSSCVARKKSFASSTTRASSSAPPTSRPTVFLVYLSFLLFPFLPTTRASYSAPPILATFFPCCFFFPSLITYALSGGVRVAQKKHTHTQTHTHTHTHTAVEYEALKGKPLGFFLEFFKFLIFSILPYTAVQDMVVGHLHFLLIFFLNFQRWRTRYSRPIPWSFCTRRAGMIFTSSLNRFFSFFLA